VPNSIGYTARIIATRPEHTVWGKSKNGTPVLKLTLAEQHQGRNDRVPEKYRRNDKATDAWVNTTTTWHKLTLMGDIAADVASDERYSHGTLVTVTDASYEEEDPWVTRDGVERAGRPETIGDRKGNIEVYVGRNGDEFTGDDLKALWDGESEIPDLPRSGGGRGRAPEYGENEGL
jgi:hypothetical protein